MTAIMENGKLECRFKSNYFNNLKETTREKFVLHNAKINY